MRSPVHGMQGLFKPLLLSTILIVFPRFSCYNIFAFDIYGHFRPKTYFCISETIDLRMSSPHGVP